LITNSVPSDSQINEIHKFIIKTEAEISILHDEMARVQRAFDQLKLQRTRLKDFVESHRGVVSIVRRLPRDILGEIFPHFLDANDQCYMPRPRGSPARLLHLVGVCDRWRTIALASPPLWRHVVPWAGPW
ncbi:hypothetical protein GGX14DRAFT_671949, partial [Mycena pura]